MFDFKNDSMLFLEKIGFSNQVFPLFFFIVFKFQNNAGEKEKNSNLQACVTGPGYPAIENKPGSGF